MTSNCRMFAARKSFLLASHDVIVDVPKKYFAFAVFPECACRRFPFLGAEDKRDEKNAKVFLWDPVKWKRKDKMRILKINLVSRNEIGAAKSERLQAAAVAFSESFRA